MMSPQALTTTTQAPTTGPGCTVHVEVELLATPAQPEPADDLALALMRRTTHPDAAVVVLDDVACVTWRLPEGTADLATGQALALGVEGALALVGEHVGVGRVREAWVEQPVTTVVLDDAVPAQQRSTVAA